jgi:hypothetical protein
MNHSIQLEEKLDSIEFGSQKKLLKAIVSGNEGSASKHIMRDSLKRRRKALTNLYDKDKGNVVHEITKKLKKQGSRGFTAKNPAKTMAHMRKLRAHKSRDGKASVVKEIKKSRDVIKKLSTNLNSKLDSLFEFEQGGGVDPAVIQQVVNDAQSMGHEGETRVAISQQLFQKLNLALQEFYANKNHIDSQVAQQPVKQ